MKRKNLGFTIVELMIILLLLGIISAVTIPSISTTMNEIRLDAAAREAVYAIKYVQSLSIKEGVEYGVKFNKYLKKFSCYKNATGIIITNPLDKKPYEVIFPSSGHLQGVNIVSASFASGNDFVTFNSLGEPNSSGAVVLAYRSLQKTVNVSSPLGKVSVN